MVLSSTARSPNHGAWEVKSRPDIGVLPEDYFPATAIRECGFHEVLVRLSALDNGHRLPQKLLLSLMPLLSFPEPVDVVKVFMYRPEYFGKRFCDLGTSYCVDRRIGRSENENSSALSPRN